MTKKVSILFTVFLSTAVLAGCALFNQAPTNQSPTPDLVSAPISPTPSQVVQPQTFEFTAQETDDNALQATQARTEVGMKQYDFGTMVESINGQPADQDHYWALYINDQYAQTGADKIELTAGDKIKWVFEEIQQGL